MHTHGMAPANSNLVFYFLKIIYLFISAALGLEKTLEGPLDRKEIKPVNPKGNQG